MEEDEKERIKYAYNMLLFFFFFSDIHQKRKLVTLYSQYTEAE